MLEDPITVSITCTPDAMALYRRLNPNADPLDLTLAVWDPNLQQYRAIDSVFDDSAMRVSGKR